jgi:hypothetical protein
MTNYNDAPQPIDHSEGILRVYDGSEFSSMGSEIDDADLDTRAARLLELCPELEDPELREALIDAIHVRVQETKERWIERGWLTVDEL